MLIRDNWLRFWVLDLRGHAGRMPGCKSLCINDIERTEGDDGVKGQEIMRRIRRVDIKADEDDSGGG